MGGLELESVYQMIDNALAKHEERNKTKERNSRFNSYQQIDAEQRRIAQMCRYINERGLIAVGIEEHFDSLIERKRELVKDNDLKLFIIEMLLQQIETCETMEYLRRITKESYDLGLISAEQYNFTRIQIESVKSIDQHNEEIDIKLNLLVNRILTTFVYIRKRNSLYK